MNRIIIDGDSLSFYCTRETANLSIDELDSRLHNLFRITDASSYLIVMSKGNYFRHQIYKDYKASRNIYRDRRKTYAKTLQAYLKDEYGAIHVEGAEADDLVAYAKTKFPEIIVCSPDKDVLKQVAGTHYDYRWANLNKGTIDETTEEGRWVTTTPDEAERFLWTQCLTGDTTDCVKGIPGIGAVRANKILSDEGEPYHVIVLNEYIRHYGQTLGIHMFQLNFRLLYLLRTDQDFVNEGISPLNIEPSHFIDLSNDSNTVIEQWNIS